MEPSAQESRENCKSSYEIDAISKSNSYRDLSDLPKRMSAELRIDATNSERSQHDISMPQLSHCEALGVNPMHQKQGQAVTQQIKVVLREEHEYQSGKK